MKHRAWQQALMQRWSALQARERLGLQGAAGVLALFLLWTQALAPALKTLENATAQHQRLDAQMQRMQALRGQAEALKNQSPPASGPWREGFSASVQVLGSAELAWSGNSATVRLKDCPPQALGQWLSALGPQWQMQISQARLKLDEEGLWQGQLTVLKP